MALFIWSDDQSRESVRVRLYDLNEDAYKRVGLDFQRKGVKFVRAPNSRSMVPGKKYLCRGEPVLELMSNGKARQLSNIQQVREVTMRFGTWRTER